MQTKFTIIDYTVDPLGVETVVDEPVKWDTIVIKMMRDKKYHGYIDLITDKDNGLAQFEFEDEAKNILKTAYDNFGIQAEVKLKVEYACSETDSWLTLYEGYFAFDMYKEHCSDRCYVTVGVESATCYMKLSNRFSQKVDMSSLKSFDSDTDNLTAYDNLNKEIMLTPKPIKYFNDWEMTVPNTKTIHDDITGVTTADTQALYYAFDWNKQSNTEIDTSDPTEFVYSSRAAGANASMRSTYDGMVKFNPVSKLDCSGTYDVTIKMQGSVNLLVGANTVVASHSSIRLVVFKKGQNVTSTSITLATLNDLFDPLYADTFNINATHTLTLDQGDAIYLMYFGVDIQYVTSPVAYNMVWEFTEATLKVESTSVCQESTAEVCMVNESLSRITEAVTNDCIRVYSDYFGRVDAEPYSSEVNGCGGLEALTNGLKIRQYTMQDGNKPSITLSMEDAMQGLNAIHNIGMGLEPDINRMGHYWLRIEPMEYFYKNDVVFTALKVFEIERETKPDKFIANFSCGYAKWEAERINGIDEIQTKRSYRTVLSQVKNTLEQISRFIASGYAIEVTRREIGGTTRDWRYDNDTFIICLTDKYISNIGFSVVLGENLITIYGLKLGIEVGDEISFTDTLYNNSTYTVSFIEYNLLGAVVKVVETVTPEAVYGGTTENLTNPFKIPETKVNSPDNMLTPDVVYNYRISPFRNAMRWFKYVVSSVKDYAGTKLIFTSGEGNIKAKGEQYYGCAIENDVVQENDNVERSIFSDSTQANPIFSQENITFEYPLTYNEFSAIFNNPYGLVEYECRNGQIKQGWIESLKYAPHDGIATFILLPKI